VTTQPADLNQIETESTTVRLRMILFLVCACQFMVILDSSIVNVALPSVQRDLGFSGTGLAWVVNGYLLTFAGFMLVGGRAADLFGQRRTIVAGLAVFSVSSLVAGLATTPDVLVGSRIVEGFGAAMLAPSTLAVINTYFTGGGARAKAFGAWSASGGLGGLAGTVVGGALTTGLSWRSVFLINLPIGVVLISVAALSLRAVQGARGESLDLLGALTGTATLAALIYGVMQSTSSGWTSPRVVVPLILGVVLLAVFLTLEARVANPPMLPLRLFRIRSVAVASGMLLLFGGVAIAMWYFTSLFMQDALGYSAFQSGMGQTPAAVLFVVVARFAAGLLPRLGARKLLLAGCALLAAGFGWLSQADAGSSYLGNILGPTVLIACGIGLTFPTLMAVATIEAARGEAGIIGGIATTASQVGGAVGLAVLATVATARGKAAHAHMPGSPLGLSYSSVFWMAVGLALAIALLTVLLPARRAED